MSLWQIGRVIYVELTEGCVLFAQLRACLLLLLLSEPARKLVHLVSLISRRNSTAQYTYRYVPLMQMRMLCKSRTNSFQEPVVPGVCIQHHAQKDNAGRKNPEEQMQCRAGKKEGVKCTQTSPEVTLL